MPLLALAFYLLGLTLAFSVRSVVQWRRTGDTGLRLDAGAAGSIRWWAKLLFVAALLLGAGRAAGGPGRAGPAWAAGPRPLRLAGLVLAAVGVTATLLAQRVDSQAAPAGRAVEQPGPQS